MALELGKTGVRKVKINTYIEEASITIDTTGWDNAGGATESVKNAYLLAFRSLTPKKNDQDKFIKALANIGITQKDATGLTLENGNSIATNELGEFILDKNANIKAIKIDVNSAVAKELEDLHKKDICVALVFENTLNTDDEKMIIFVPSITYIYQEEVTGKDLHKINIDLTKTVVSPSDFRYVDKFVEA